MHSVVRCKVLIHTNERNSGNHLIKITINYNNLTFETEATVDSSSSASSPNDNKLKFLQEIKFEVNKTCGDKISYFDVITTLPKSNLFLISSKSLLLIIKGNYM